MPRVSVIISTYNGEADLPESVSSILSQTFSDFELIIVDDGSDDCTTDLLKTFADPRIKVLYNERNLGIAGSQNRALSAATGEYLALMDHDDISLPNRLQTHVDFLDKHPETGMLASNSININRNNEVTSHARYPVDEVEFAWNTLILGCPNVHTTLMIRRSALDHVGGYENRLRYACDYDLISRLILSTQVANLEEPLVKWREHAGSVSRSKTDALMSEAAAIAKNNASLLLNGASIDDSSWQALRRLIASPASAQITLSSEEVNGALTLLRELQSSFYRIKKFKRETIERHQRQLHLSWGKHFLALTFRGKGARDFKCRWELLKWSAKFLFGFERSQFKDEQVPVLLEATHSETLPRS